MMANPIQKRSDKEGAHADSEHETV
jgi:hypothetical protein